MNVKSAEFLQIQLQNGHSAGWLKCSLDASIAGDHPPLASRLQAFDRGFAGRKMGFVFSGLAQPANPNRQLAVVVSALRRDAKYVPISVVTGSDDNKLSVWVFTSLNRPE